MAAETQTLPSTSGSDKAAALAPGDQRARYQQFVDRITTQVISAMPLTVPDADLKRARARFRVAFSADAQGALQECSPESVARAIVMSAMSGLYPGGPRPDVWLIPRRNKHKGNVLEAQWQMSFRGYIRLARRAGWELEPVMVYEGEKFEIQEGSAPSMVHVRNLELPATWEALRYGYIRVYPTGKREASRIAYLTKAEIQKRRNKAQDQSIWNEWPLEMAYKTLCHYAGARELFPTDDPARYAMESSEQAEIGSGAAATETWGALPAGSKTDGLAARLAAKSEGAVIDLSASEGRPVDLAGMMPTGEEGTQEPAQAAPPASLFDDVPPAGVKNPQRMSPQQVEDCRETADRNGISVDDLEGFLGGKLAELEGETAVAVEQRVVDAITGLKKKAAKKN